jgi:FkbM family methyltransferase
MATRKPFFLRMKKELRSVLGNRDTKPAPGSAAPHAPATPHPSNQQLGAGRQNSQPLLQSANLCIKRCKHGFMMFHTNDTYIGRSLDIYGEFSEGEMELFGQFIRPGMSVVDAGANIGVHTIYFAKAVGAGGQVLAFEPQRVLHQILCANLALNGLANVVAVNVALGREEGTSLVPRIDYAKGGNFGGVVLGKARNGEEVPVKTLDSWGLKSCDLIKIDVEGMEQAVLEGAKTVLEQHKPLLYVENDRVEKQKALIEWLLARDYRLFWHRPRLFNPNNHFAATENVFGNIISANMLCVPRSKPVDVKDLREISAEKLPAL